MFFTEFLPEVTALSATYLERPFEGDPNSVICTTATYQPTCVGAGPSTLCEGDNITDMVQPTPDSPISPYVLENDQSAHIPISLSTQTPLSSEISSHYTKPLLPALIKILWMI